MQRQLQESDSLKDLDGVRVAVEEPLPRGFTRDAITSSVESQLRAEGITVPGMGEFPTGDPHLRVTVSVSPERDGLVAAGVQLDFVQIVFLRRNPQVTFNRARTWKARSQVVIVPAAQVVREVLRDLSRQVTQFVADYKAAN